MTIEPTTLSVVAGRSNEYTAALATEPTGDVTVTVSGHAGTDVTPDKTTLTFTVDNWDMAQTVTVSATESAATGKVTLAPCRCGRDYGSVTAEPVRLGGGLRQTLTVRHRGAYGRRGRLGDVGPTGTLPVSGGRRTLR